ncbi:hypothetical protein [Streptomyces microflavus]|uniref:hypothetical protein n=1 Tax=Streptomyces microflavus TaxID=1919 RepID=UPI003664C9EC
MDTETTYTMRTADGKRSAEVTGTTITVFEGGRIIAIVPKTDEHRECPGSIWSVIAEAETSAPDEVAASEARILVAADEQADPERVRDALTAAWYDLATVHGPNVPLVVVHAGRAVGAVKVGLEWAAEQGFTAERYTSQALTAHVGPQRLKRACRRPVYRYAA